MRHRALMEDAQAHDELSTVAGEQIMAKLRLRTPMLFALAVVLDALTHPGPADLSRVDRALCLRLTMPGATAADLAAQEIEAWTVGGAALLEHHVDREPPLADYARSEGGRR